MNASGPNELKVSYICIGNTQFSQYFDTMMSLCCLICTDEITKCIYKTPKINPPPPPVYATNDFKIGSVDFISIEWWGHFFSPFSLLPTPPPPGPRYSFLHLPFSQFSPSPSGPSPPPFFKSPLPITFSPFLLPYMPRICSIASKKKIIHENSDISHPPRRSHCPFRIILFMRMFVRHANIDYGYVINAFLRELR